MNQRGPIGCPLISAITASNELGCGHPPAPAGGGEAAIAIVAAFLTVALITAGAAVGLNGPAGGQKTHQHIR